jgi:hypothetical protein
VTATDCPNVIEQTNNRKIANNINAAKTFMVKFSLVYREPNRRENRRLANCGGDIFRLQPQLSTTLLTEEPCRWEV